MNDNSQYAVSMRREGPIWHPFYVARLLDFSTGSPIQIEIIGRNARRIFDSIPQIQACARIKTGSPLAGFQALAELGRTQLAIRGVRFEIVEPAN